jgi:hypothetical protein
MVQSRLSTIVLLLAMVCASSGMRLLSFPIFSSLQTVSISHVCFFALLVSAVTSVLKQSLGVESKTPLLIETQAEVEAATPPPTPIPITYPPGSNNNQPPQIIVNVPKPPDFIFDHWKLWLTLIIIIAVCCICGVFLYFCWEKLIPCVSFFEHCVFYTIKAAFMPLQITYAGVKMCVYPIKECMMSCCKGTGEYYRPYTRTT